VSAAVIQPTFADLGEALSEVTFCVVDLETTGAGSSAGITEIGAVKVRGGEQLGEFQTLVNPGAHIPASISVLTGITDSMVAGAPSIAAALPSFLEFAAGCVLVAHNAGFDVGFLKRACEELGYAWPKPKVVDTVALARQALLRDEVRNYKLGTLAAHFHTAVTPDHRALDDARATVEVLHGLLERVGSLGVFSLEELLDFTRRVSPARRAKRGMAEGLPQLPGVYCFVAELADKQGILRRQVLYVGKSKNIYRRVRSYFTSAETRRRMDEMVRIATRVEATVCRTELEAQVLELRLIAAHSPRYNRRSKFPDRYLWLRLTDEPFPRFSVVRKPPPGPCLGPLSGRAAAADAMLVAQEAFGLRQCNQRIPLHKPAPACALAQLGRCPAPCQHLISPADYAVLVDAASAALAGDVRPALHAAASRVAELAAAQRYEQAGEIVGRLEGYLAATAKHHRLASLAACPLLVAAYPVDKGWEIHVIRHGHLAAATQVRRAAEVIPAAAAAVAESGTGPDPLVEETQLIADWLERPGVRIIEIEGTWAWPLHAGVGSLPQALAEPDQSAPIEKAASRSSDE
jgi:DNA polymerase-3 subunit epsilon